MEVIDTMIKDIIVSVSLWSIIHSYGNVNDKRFKETYQLVSVSLWSIIHSYVVLLLF